MILVNKKIIMEYLEILHEWLEDRLEKEIDITEIEMLEDDNDFYCGVAFKYDDVEYQVVSEQEKLDYCQEYAESYVDDIMYNFRKSEYSYLENYLNIDSYLDVEAEIMYENFNDNFSFSEVFEIGNYIIFIK